MAVLWVTSVVGLFVVAPVVVLLAQRVIREARQAARYLDDVLEHGVGITAALEPVPVLVETRRLVADLATGAGDYVQALRRLP
jgi:hypothetical protein